MLSVDQLSGICPAIWRGYGKPICRNQWSKNDYSPDPDPYPLWHQTQATGGQNYSLWNDRQASEYLEQARIIVDPAERTRLYRNFQVRFTNELPALPLFYSMYTCGIDAEVQGVRIGPLFEPRDRYAAVTDWFLFSERSVGQDEGNSEVP